MEARLDDQHRKQLLALARDAIARRIGAVPAFAPARPDPRLPPAPGVFVTLTKGGHLRGCVGQLEPRGSLEEMITACAVAAATADPRFPSLRPEELPEVTIEVSLLDPPTPASGPDEIVVGTHGIIVRRGARRGLLLPQVGAETGWTAASLLDQAALKAGLPEDAWRSGASIEVFTAEVFSEAGPPVPHRA